MAQGLVQCIGGGTVRQELIESHGEINIVHRHPLRYVAMSNDESGMLAILKRRPDKSLSALLRRLDKAVYRAIEFEELHRRSEWPKLKWSNTNVLSEMARQ